MAEERVQRRLAAILAADAVGYSRLMGADEEGTLAALTGHLKDFIEPCIAEHRRRLVKTTGDGLLTEFAILGVRRLEQLLALRKHGAEISAEALLRDYDDIPAFAECGVRAIRVWEEDLTQRRLEAVHNAGSEIWITAGLRSQGEIAGTIDQYRLLGLNNLGIDAVLLNDPSLLVIARQHWKIQ